MPAHDVIEHRQGENEIEKMYTKSIAEIDSDEKKEILDKTVLKTADTVMQYEIIFKLQTLETQSEWIRATETNSEIN